MYFHLGTLCNSAFITLSKCQNMRITYDTGLELILFLFFILLMIIKLSIVHIEKLSVRTQAKLDFPGDLDNVICMSTFPVPSSTFPLTHLKGAPAFQNKCVLPKPTQPQEQSCCASDQCPTKPSSPSPRKACIDYRVLKPSN